MRQRRTAGMGGKGENPMFQGTTFQVTSHLGDLMPGRDVNDRLPPQLVIRESKTKGAFVEGLTTWVVQSPGAVYDLLSVGGSGRIISQTRSNDVSSRSHTVRPRRTR